MSIAPGDPERHHHAGATAAHFSAVNGQDRTNDPDEHNERVDIMARAISEELTEFAVPTSLNASPAGPQAVAEEVSVARRLTTEEEVTIPQIAVVYPNKPTQSEIPKRQSEAGPSKEEEVPRKPRDIWKELGNVDFSTQIPPWVLPTINLVCVIWSILAIELMIKWNNITQVHTIQSVGQLIPFVIGVVGFLKLLRDISVERIQLWMYEVVLVRHSTLKFSRRWYSDSVPPRTLS
jgi:hypothetical protein